MKKTRGCVDVYIYMSALSVYSFNNEKTFATTRVGYIVRWVAVLEESMLHLKPEKEAHCPTRATMQSLMTADVERKAKYAGKTFGGFRL